VREVSQHRYQQSHGEDQARGHTVDYCCHYTVDRHQTYNNAVLFHTYSTVHDISKVTRLKIYVLAVRLLLNAKHAK